MQDIESSKATGVDKLSGRFLKDGTDILAKPVSALCNLSISRGVFPNDPSNYRPISLLPAISKIIEKVVHEQINAFLSNENIVYNYQSCYRANHSTNF